MSEAGIIEIVKMICLTVGSLGFMAFFYGLIRMGIIGK